MKVYIKFFIVVFFYRILLDIIYSEEITPFFEYAGFVDYHNSSSAITSWSWLICLTFLVIPFYNNTKDYAISITALVFFFIRVVPMSSYILFVPVTVGFILLNFIFWIVFFCLLYFFSSKKIYLRHNPYRENGIKYIALFCSAVVLIVSGVYTHFRLHFSLLDVYDLRNEARDFNLPSILAYSISSVANVVPLLIVYYFHKGKSIISIFLVLILLLDFGIDGSKSVIFKTLFCLLLAKFYLIDLKKYFGPILIVTCFVTIMVYLLYDFRFLSDLMVRRIFYVPCNLDACFYDYIYHHEPLYFDTKAFGELCFTIGAEYFGSDAMRANNGLFSDAYGNLGNIGCVIMPLIYSSFIYLFSYISKGCNKGVIGFSAILIAFTIESTAFTTTLLTHGLLLLLLTLYCMPRSDYQSIEKNKNNM